MGPSVAEFTSFVLLAVSSSVALLASVKRRVWKGRVGLAWSAELRDCAACGYSRDGLGVEAACPECGVSAADATATWRLIVDSVRLRRWQLVVLINAATALLVWPLARWALVRAYVRDGFDAERASRWVMEREFSNYSELHVSAGALMFPLLLVTAGVLPLLIHVPRKDWWIGVTAAVWLVALVGSVLRIVWYC